MNKVEGKYKIVKVFNNNVILVTENEKEKIILGTGLGFGKKSGQIIDKPSNIDKIFSMEDEFNSSKFKELMTQVDDETIGICEEIIYMISKELNEELNEKIHVSLTDHVAFTLLRLKQDDEIENPFLVETETLYKREFDLAKKAVRMLQKRTGVQIPDGEIGFITLHIHSARNRGKLSNTIKYTYISNSIVEFIEDELNIDIDRTSLDYARFITHIRFAIERIMIGKPVKNELLVPIKRKFKESYALARRAAEIISDGLDKPVDEDEIGYLAIHIQKLKSTI